MKGNEYLFMALFINFLATLSNIFENFVKILTVRYIIIFRIPLSSGETLTIQASSAKLSFDKVLFIPFDKG